MNILQTLDLRNPILFRVGMANLAVFFVFLVLSFIDQRTILGINAWIKPMKFALTSFIYLVTLVFYQFAIPEIHSGKIRTFSIIIAIMLVGEVVLIGMQSARGVISHFNQSNAFDGLVFTIMGIMIVINTIVVIRFFLRMNGTDSISEPMLLAFKLGAALFIVGSLVGGLMSGLNRHSVGAEDGGPGLPLVNWSTQAGDLRIAHFIGLHALQIIPLAAWLYSKIGIESKTSIWITSVIYLVLFVLTLSQAMMGRPLLALH